MAKSDGLGQVIDCKLVGMLLSRMCPQIKEVEFISIHVSDLSPEWFVRVNGVPLEICRKGDYRVRVVSEDLVKYMPHNETAVMVEKALNASGADKPAVVVCSVEQERGQ